MANDVFFLTKHLILFVNVVLWFYFCLPSQCFVTTTKNKALVPIRTHTALPQLSGLISLSFSLFPLLSLHSYTSLAFSANSLPPRVFFFMNSVLVPWNYLFHELSVFIVASESCSWRLIWGIQIVSLSKRSCFRRTLVCLNSSLIYNQYLDS